MAEDISRSRLLSQDVLGETLAADGGSEALRSASRAFVEGGDVEVGLWEAGPGADTDVEVDEVFLVLAGSGRVGFEDGSSIELRPGVLVRLRAGDRTSWVVDERIRKIYLI